MKTLNEYAVRRVRAADTHTGSRLMMFRVTCRRRRS